MFKNVEYVGFEGNPELKAKTEQLTPVLSNEIRRSREEVSVMWSPQPSDPRHSLNLTLTRTLPNGVTGSALGTFTPADWAEAWLTRSRCRDVWSDLLEELSRQLEMRVKESLSELLEV
jgi:hypothetical protein